MKKKFLLLLLATVMCLSMALVSCTKNDDAQALKFSDIIKSVPTDQDNVISSYTRLNITGEIVKMGRLFAVAENQSYDSGYATGNSELRVYNLHNDTCLLTLTKGTVTDTYTGVTTATNYYFDLIDEDFIAVLKETYDTSDYGNSYYSDYFNTNIKDYAEYNVTVYDKSGAEVHSIDDNDLYYSDFDYYYEEEMSDYINDDYSYSSSDLFYVGNKLYKYDDKGEKVFIKEFGIEYKPDLEYLFPIGDYYCYSNGGSSYYSRGLSVQIFNEKLEPIADYSFPSYANTGDASLSFYDIGNGRIFIQYVETLHQDAKDYDYRQGATGKYDLVTLILNVTDNTVTELEDVNYKVHDIVSTTAKYESEDCYNDVVENIAIISRIDENEHLDTSPANYEIVGISSEGKITANINIEGSISSIPAPLSENLFFAYSAIDSDMCYIYNETGDIIAYRSLYDYDHSGNYVFTDKAIYTLTGEKIYDLKGKDYHAMNNGSAIIWSTEDDVTTISLFCDGSVKPIGTEGGDNPSIDGFDYFSNYYYTYDSDTGNYTYYTVKGDVIGTFETELYYEIEGDDFVILSSREYNSFTGEYEYNYYKFY